MFKGRISASEFLITGCNIPKCLEMVAVSCTSFNTQIYKVKLEVAPLAQSVECSLWEMGGHGFSPGRRNTKLIKNVTSCSTLGTQTYGVELGLVIPVSG